MRMIIAIIISITISSIISILVQEIRWRLKRKLNKLWDEPEYDATDFAHPAFYRGETFSAYQFRRLINDVLDGKNNCTGRMNEPIESVRNRVWKLKRERDRLFRKDEKLTEENFRLEDELKRYQDIKKGIISLIKEIKNG